MSQVVEPAAFNISAIEFARIAVSGEFVRGNRTGPGPSGPGPLEPGPFRPFGPHDPRVGPSFGFRKLSGVFRAGPLARSVARRGPCRADASRAFNSLSGHFRFWRIFRDLRSTCENLRSRFCRLVSCVRSLRNFAKLILETRCAGHTSHLISLSDTSRRCKLYLLFECILYVCIYCM